MSRLRSRITYPNVTATMALFIALGGTSYAVSQLPRNSVGARQVRADAVGASEIRSSAVRSRELRNRSVALRDISLGARRSLRGAPGPAGPQGPPGPSGIVFAAAVNSGGVIARGVGVDGSNHQGGSALYEIRFTRDVSACFAVASPSDVPGGGTTTPPNGEVVTSISGSSVFVRTSNSAGTPTDLPFHLIVSC
jgi:hypothetical protein